MKIRDLFLLTLCVIIAVVIGLAAYNGGTNLLTQIMATPTLTGEEEFIKMLRDLPPAPH